MYLACIPYSFHRATRLCNVKFTSVKAQLNLDDVTINTSNGDFNPTSLAHVINTDAVNRLVVRSWMDKAGLCFNFSNDISNTELFSLRTASRRSTLIFCVNLAHLRDLTVAFRNAGIDARYIYAATPAAERKELVEAFRAAKYPVLLNVGQWHSLAFQLCTDLKAANSYPH